MEEIEEITCGHKKHNQEIIYYQLGFAELYYLKAISLM